MRRRRSLRLDNDAIILIAILVDGGWSQAKAAAFVRESLAQVDAYIARWIDAVRRSGR